MKFDTQPPTKRHETGQPLEFNRDSRRDQVARQQPPIPGSTVEQPSEGDNMNLNQVVLIGRLARAPQLRYVGEKAVLQIPLAIVRGSSEPDVIPVTVWGTEQQLKGLVPLDRGALLAVQGRIAKRSWEGSDGLEVVASDVQIAPATQVTNGRG